jgi:RNA polymerase sigma factor (sigma-70 family)
MSDRPAAPAPALFTKHQQLAALIASDWRIPGMDHDDVRQEARIALWEACRGYDKRKGRFPAFAGVVVRRRMRDLLQAAMREKRAAVVLGLFDAPAPDEREGHEQLQLILDGLDALTQLERDAVRDHLNGRPSKKSKSHDSALDRARAKLKDAV